MPILTDASIRKYAAQAKRREIPDSRATGLYLVIQPSGAKSFALRFRRPDGRPAKLTMGRVDLAGRETRDEPVIGAPLTLGQARELAAQIDRKRQRGLDVVEEHRAAEARKGAAAADRAANSFAICVRDFFVDHRTRNKHRPRRWRDNAALLGLRYEPSADPATAESEIIKGGLASVWGDKPVASVDGHDVHAVVSEARKLGSEGRARKLHAALSVFFAWLVRERRVAANPCAWVWRPGPPPARERVLTDTEIVTFWRACDAIGWPFGPLFQFLLLTGCRLREAADMARNEIADGVWTIPGTRTKNGRSLTLALPPPALQILNGMPNVSGTFVFSTNGKTPVSGFSRSKRHLDEAMAEIAGKPVAPWRLHDLRRTAASGMAALGVSLPVIEKILNHVSGSFGGIVGVYQRHEFSAEKAEALERWARHIEGLVAGQTNVVALKKPREDAR
jgi:integrase